MCSTSSLDPSPAETASAQARKVKAHGPAPGPAREGSTSIQIHRSFRPSLLSLRINQLRSREVETPTQVHTAGAGQAKAHGPGFPACLHLWPQVPEFSLPFQQTLHQLIPHNSIQDPREQAFESPSAHIREDSMDLGSQPLPPASQKKNHKNSPMCPLSRWDSPAL